MLENVTVIEECPNRVGIGEVHSQSDTVIGAFAAPIRDIDGIPHCGIINRLPIHFQHPEVYLVNVKNVIFG